MEEGIINCKNWKESDAIILSANYDRTSSFGKGADGGPAAIIGCLNNQIEFFERITKAEICKTAKISHIDLGNLNLLSPEEMVAKVSERFDEFYKEERFVVMLGGEHSVSNGAFHALAKEKPEEITVLHIDAHADLRDSDEDYSDKSWGKYSHCAVMRRAHDVGLKSVQVGVRAYSKEEEGFMKENKLTVFEWGHDNVPEIDEIVNAIQTDKVYLSIDVDGIDPSHMPATGTPVQGGLEWYYLQRLLKRLFEKKVVIGADIVEVAPREFDSLTEYGAAQLCYNIIAFKAVGL